MLSRASNDLHSHSVDFIFARLGRLWGIRVMLLVFSTNRNFCLRLRWWRNIGSLSKSSEANIFWSFVDFLRWRCVFCAAQFTVQWCAERNTQATQFWWKSNWESTPSTFCVVRKLKVCVKNRSKRRPYLRLSSACLLTMQILYNAFPLYKITQIQNRPHAM